MQNWLTNATKTRLINEIRDILYSHPKYRGDYENVQNHFAFSERPQRGVVISGVSAENLRLSADNYMGMMLSFVMQTKYGDCPGTSVEWVKENQFALEKISKNRTVFPSPPGVYIICIDSLPNNATKSPGTFYIESYLTVQDEPLIQFTKSDEESNEVFAFLSNQGIYHRSTKLWLNGRRPLLYGVDFNVNHSTGEVTFLKKVPAGSYVMADYKYSVPRGGPYEFYNESTNNDAIPGAIIAFGDRVWKDDKVAVVVYPHRTDSAEVFGGKFEVGFDLTVFSRDSEDREKLSDYIIISMLNKQKELGYEGLVLLDISPGGESEEIYNDAMDDYFYDSSINVRFLVDWQVFSPLPVEVFRIETTSEDQEKETGFLDGTYKPDLVGVVSKPIDMLGESGPANRRIHYERIR